MIAIPPADAARLWPQIEGYVREANAYAGGKLEPVDWLVKVLTGQADLFVSVDHTLVMICEAQQFARNRVYAGLILAGEHQGGHDWDEVVRTVREAAQLRQCAYVEMYGRPGWRSIVESRGFKPACTVWRLEVNQ